MEGSSYKDVLFKMLVRHEDLRLKPYKDSVGKLTIGVGRNLDDIGISKMEAFSLLVNDIDRVLLDAKTLPWFEALNDARKVVILSMIFNIGFDGFKKFKKMMIALNYADYKSAASEMKNSLWATQVGTRAVELSYMMLTGNFVESMKGPTSTLN